MISDHQIVSPKIPKIEQKVYLSSKQLLYPRTDSLKSQKIF